MAIDYGKLAGVLDEIEQEVIRVGDQECERFHQESQLKVVLLLLLRAASLLRPLLLLLRSRHLDAFDSVERALSESWYLAFELRLKTSSSKAALWLHNKERTWSADRTVLDAYANHRGHRAPNLNKDYRSLCSLVHPTRAAAENSLTLAGARMGFPVDNLGIERQLATFESAIQNLMYRLLWLTLDEDADFIPLHVEAGNMPTASQFAGTYEHLEPGI